jgi:hypothetical protein
MSGQESFELLLDYLEGVYTPNPRMARDADGVTRWQQGERACKWPRDEKEGER